MPEIEHVMVLSHGLHMPRLFQEMTSEEKSKITDLNKCDFSEMSEYFKAQSEARKQMSKEEKQVNMQSRRFLETSSSILFNLNIFMHSVENQGGE